MAAPEVTQHAAERWRQRFPDRDIYVEYARATQRAGRKIRRLLRQTCPRHAAYLKASYHGRYVCMTTEGIVFIMAPPEVVITVLDLRSMV